MTHEAPGFSYGEEVTDDIIEKTIEEFNIKNHKKVGRWEYELIKGEMNGVIEKHNSRL